MEARTPPVSEHPHETASASAETDVHDVSRPAAAETPAGWQDPDSRGWQRPEGAGNPTAVRLPASIGRGTKLGRDCRGRASSDVGQREAAHMEFRVLGALEVRRAGDRVPVPAGRAQIVLATLIAQCDQTVIAERLIRNCWGDSHPTTRRPSYTPSSVPCAGSSDSPAPLCPTAFPRSSPSAPATD